MKLKRMLALVLTIAMVLSVAVLPVNAASSDFTDVAGHWAEGSIERWTKAGVIQGYGDGTFAPDAEIKRAEVAEVMRKVLGLIELDENVYTDVPAGSWYEKSILACAKVDMFEGYGDGTMKPEDSTRRIEMFKVLVTAFLMSGGEPATELAPFSDKGQVENWAKGYTATMIFNKAVGGYEDGTLRPVAYVTRAQLVTLLDRIIGAYVNAEGQISLTSEGEVKGNVILVNANCENNVNIKKTGAAVEVAVVGGETKTFTTDTESIYVVIVNEESAEVTDVQSVQVVGATDEKQATIKEVPVPQPEPEHVCTPGEKVYTGNCASKVEWTISCTDSTCKKVLESGEAGPMVHTFVDGVCSICGISTADAMKFELSVESGASVTATVTDDYVAELVVEPGEVSAASVAITAKMQNVASLGGGVKQHTINITTNLTAKPVLKDWLQNAWEFTSTNVVVNVEGGAKFTYEVTGAEVDGNAVVTAKPVGEDGVKNARDSWQALTSHVETVTQEVGNSYVSIADNSYVEILDKALVFEKPGDLVLDNFNEMTTLKNNIQNSVTIIDGEAGSKNVEILVGAGTVLAVDQSVATLKDNCKVVISGIKNYAILNNSLENIRTAVNGDNSTYVLLKELVTLVNNIIGAADGDDEIYVDVTFGADVCDHKATTIETTGTCEAGRVTTETCNCGVVVDSTTDYKTHDFVDGVCAECDTTEEEALKFSLSVEAGGYVDATVTNDYVAVITGDYNTPLTPEAVTLTAKMQNVGSLGVDGVREHSVTINTDIDADPMLKDWLESVIAFENADIEAIIDGKAVTYQLTGDEGTITAAPNDVVAAREAWQALTAKANIKTETVAADNSYIVIAKNSYLQIATEKLSFEEGAEDLTIDPNGSLSSLEESIRASVQLTEETDNGMIEAVLGKGTKLAVGSSVATLQKDCKIVIENVDCAGLNNILSILKNAEGEYAMAKALVELLDAVVGSVDAAEDNVIVTVTFA